MMGVIFDLDQTIIDSRIAYEARKNRDWENVYKLIPSMKPYTEVVNLIKAMISQGIEVAIVTSSPASYCKKVLEYLGITGVIMVCYHDTNKHKPEPDPILLAIKRMKNQEGKRIIAVGDDDNDILAANRAGIISVQGFWGNPYGYSTAKYQPHVFCRDEKSLVKYFSAQGVQTGKNGLRKRCSHVYQLFDYYPMTRTHDKLSEELFDEVKEKNSRLYICQAFCQELEKKGLPSSDKYGIFVVPSSTANNWNKKLTDYVVPRLVQNMGLVDCSKYILRHTTHDKQAFGGDRSVESNLSTIKLQYLLPPDIKGAFIIDDITTSGNIFESCRILLSNAGIDRDKIYCLAIGGTV